MRRCLLIVTLGLLLRPGHGLAGATATEGQIGLTELRSEGGVLSVTLRAEQSVLALDGLNLPGQTYNGLYPGPLLRLRQGEVLRVRLENHLSQATNLHFHGMRSSPRGNGDNVHLSVAPGDAVTYEIRVPIDQPPGLYWYHSHIHGASEAQVTGGLSGALMIDPAEQPHERPAEHIFVLKDLTFDDDTGNPRIDDTLHGNVQTINGALHDRETMHAGGGEIWRFSNQSADRRFHISLQGHRFRILAVDGEPVGPGQFAETLDIVPGGRAEVFVEAGDPGTYALLSKGVLTGAGPDRKPDRELATLVVDGAAPQVPPPAPVPRALPPDLAPAAISARRLFVFSQTKTLDPDRQQFLINGKRFDPSRVDVRVPLGGTEEWTIRNDSDDFHTFHIHQLAFQVMAINDQPVPDNGRVDTVQVPERGSVTLRMAFTSPLILGRFMFHCHVLKHEDKGMMGQIEVYDPQPPTLLARLDALWFRIWCWFEGVPWSLCG